MLQTLRGVEELVLRYHNKEVSARQLYEGALKGLLESLNDPYSQYLNEEQLKSLNTSLDAEYGGIGITIELIGGNITVVSTFPGSPAERAGIKAGDVIVNAEGRDLVGKVPQDASLVIRGEPGTTVSLTLRRPPANKTFTFLVKREQITQPTVSWKDLGDGIYYIQIAQFAAQTARDFPVLMDFLRSKGLQGLVLDLRNNPGGLLDSCMAVADELVPQGSVVELRLRTEKQVLESSGAGPVVPTVALVNQGTASAAEILAGAIRDRGVGVLVGERTFGKACVQSIVPIGGGFGGIRMTIADYYTPAGVNLAGTGLQPDVKVVPTAVEPPAKITYKRPLVRGLVGLDVLALQDALNYTGRNAGEPDGVLGPMTWAALEQFCEDEGVNLGNAAESAIVDAIDAAVTEKSHSAPDEVLARGKQALETRLATGNW
ncbi:MAG: S41 family peptidase [Bacillota bacterium]